MEMAIKPPTNNIKVPLWIPFFLALFAFLFSSAFLPSIRLFYFAPFLAIVLQRKPLQSSLWIAAFCGLFYDLFDSGVRFGLYSLLTVGCTLVSYRCKRWFYEERLFSIPLYTALISILFGLLQCLFLPFHLNHLVHFLIFFPLFDAIYAFLWFTCPIILYNRLQKRPST
ncbi:MAG: hypothetical protein KR126chlam3_01681 [Chlamydiae bacterium]|nr:hypothetical protein [Chlamydiota bacterium]